nr:MAG TPA: protein of unknown function DUF1746 [Caudoviricetes sp.]
MGNTGIEPSLMSHHLEIFPTYVNNYLHGGIIINAV